MSKTVDHADHHPADPEMSAVPAAPVNGTGPTAKDPVCGMTVTLKPDSRTESFGGTDFHFCSGKCQTKFMADLWFYASGRAAGRKKGRSGQRSIYLPDAPRNHPRCTRCLSDLWHGTGADAAIG